MGSYPVSGEFGQNKINEIYNKTAQCCRVVDGCLLVLYVITNLSYNVIF